MDGQFYLVASAPLRVGTIARQARANDDVTRGTNDIDQEAGS